MGAGTLDEEWVTVYHGSIHDASRIQAHGLDVSRLPTWISRDLTATQNAIDPAIRVDRMRDWGIIEARIPQSEFERVFAPSERAYSGFNSLLWASSEIVLRTPEQIAVLNRYIVR